MVPGEPAEQLDEIGPEADQHRHQGDPGGFLAERHEGSSMQNMLDTMYDIFYIMSDFLGISSRADSRRQAEPLRSYRHDFASRHHPGRRGRPQLERVRLGAV